MIIRIDARQIITTERFSDILRQSARVGDCLLFQGYDSGAGYGRIEFQEQQIYVHRAAFAMAAQRPIGDGLCVCHTCDTRNCIEPSHLFEGTDADNVTDMWNKQRGVAPPVRYGEKNHKATLSNADVAALRALMVDGNTKQRDAALLAETFATSSDSAIFDMSLMTVSERTSFFTEFAETIRRKNKGPLHLVIDEAHLFMPQAGAASGGAVPAMLHAGNNLVSLGRSRGLRIAIALRAAKSEPAAGNASKRTTPSSTRGDIRRSAKMKYVVIDTETSGLFGAYKDAAGKPIPADAEGGPRLAELAMIFLDENLQTERETALYVRPDNWKMDPGATEKNGLTDEFLNEHGQDLALVLEEYRKAIEDEKRTVVAFGAQFDCKIMRGELRRAGMNDMFDITLNSCLMRSCQGLGIKKASGKGGWPSLADVCAHFSIEQEKAHTGLSDARAAAAILTKLLEAGTLQPPGIHKAAGRED